MKFVERVLVEPLLNLRERFIRQFRIDQRVKVVVGFEEFAEARGVPFNPVQFSSRIASHEHGLRQKIMVLLL